MSETLASCLLLNQVNEAVHQGYLTFAALNQSYQLVISYRDEHRRAHAFMLRLYADYQGGMRHDWPRDLLIQPVYEELLVHWRTADPEQIKKLLREACDRHLREARRDTKTSFYDFNDESTMRTPLEILMILRLREFIGLSNPILRHPLMNPPFDKLSAAEPLPPDDLIMEATLARLRRDWPDYDDVVSLDSVKRAAM